ncbi:Plant organelle RNA recognition domain-containing protein [Artemisia annua]|uniref:Plant organelle RNA recognition domain-containing protein n=1 Tax=Artemisia annua TaxID=35608 RepID=A0A2U1PAC7_ARTAN|nr:Plant organelle RNA recognition domain-containing protein [Artemisia annua]
MPQRNGGSWNALISAYSRNGFINEGLRLLLVIKRSIWVFFGIRAYNCFPSLTIPPPNIITKYTYSLSFSMQKHYYSGTASPSWNVIIRRHYYLGEEREVVAKFLRIFPFVFEEFTGPEYDLPWFKLTLEAVRLNDEKEIVYKDFKDNLEERSVNFVLMSIENRMPFIWGGCGGLGECFEVVELGDGLKGLVVSKK